MKFIKLTRILDSGIIRFNIDNIETYFAQNGCTYVYSNSKDGIYKVKEIPEQIDRLLGIEETEAKPEVITKVRCCKSCVGYVAFQSEKGCPDCMNGSNFEEMPF